MPVPVGVAELVRVPLSEPLPVFEDAASVRLTVGLPLPVAVAVPLLRAVDEADTPIETAPGDFVEVTLLAEPVPEGVALGVGDTDGACAPIALADTVALGEAVPAAEPEREPVTVGEDEGEGVEDGGAPSEGDCELAPENDGVIVAQSVGEALLEGVPLLLSVPVCEDVAEAMPLPLCVRVGEGESDGVALPLGLCEGVPVPLLPSVAVELGVPELQGVALTVAVADAKSLGAAEPLPVELPVALVAAEAEAVPEATPLLVELPLLVGALLPGGLPVAVAAACAKAVAVFTLEGLFAALAPSVAVVAKVPVADAAAAPLAVAVAGALETPLPVAVAMTVAVATPVCVPATEAPALPAAALEALGDAAAVADALPDSVLLLLGVVMLENVGVPLPLCVPLAVPLVVRETLAVALEEGVGEGVGDEVALAVAVPVTEAETEGVALVDGAHVSGAPSGAKAAGGTASRMGAELDTLPSTALHRVALFKLLMIDTVARLMRSGTASERGHTTTLPMASASAAEKLTQGAGASLKKKLLVRPSTAFAQPLKG